MALRDLRDALITSLQQGFLFGCHDEPLDAAGKRIVRVIQQRIDDTIASAQADAAIYGDDE